MKPTASANAVLTVAELARRWKCHRQSVMDLIHDDKIDAFRIGRQYRIALKEIERFEAGRAA